MYMYCCRHMVMKSASKLKELSAQVSDGLYHKKTYYMFMSVSFCRMVFVRELRNKSKTLVFLRAEV